MVHVTPRSLSRRRFLARLAATSGALAMVNAAVTACQTAPPPAAPPAGSAASSPAAASPAAQPTAPPPAAVAVASASPAVVASPAIVRTASRSGTLTAVDGTEPDGFDPPKHTGPFQHATHAMFDGLCEFDDKMNVRPALAVSWQANQDASTWTFKLRENVKFHDGTGFDAGAAKASLERIIAPNSGATRRSAYLVMKQIDAVDATTLRITLDGPYLDFPFLLADSSALIVSPTAAAKAGDAFGRTPVGTGPYRFENWVAGQRVEMLPFDGYWGEPAKLEKIIFRPIREGAARSAVLRTGEADFVLNLPPDDLAQLESQPQVTIARQTLSSQVMAEFRQTKPPFNDVRVRRAINHAVNKQAIADSILGGMAEPSDTPGLPGLWGSVKLTPFAYDPALAKKLLAEAGFPNGFEARMQYVSGRWAKDDQVAEAVQGFLAEVGVKMTVKKIDASELVPMLRIHPDEMAGEMPMPLRSSSFLDNHLQRMYESESAIIDTAQRSGYKNAEVDRLFNLQRKEQDQAKRLQLFADLQKTIWEDAPFLYLLNRKAAFGHSKKVSGFISLPIGTTFIHTIAKSM